MSRTRGMWNTRGMWAAGGMVAVVMALTGYLALNGDDGGSDTAKGGGKPDASGSPSAAPTYQAPDGWTEPDRWTVLPRGLRTDRHGSPVGFPHTTEGAAAMMAAANNTGMEGNKSAEDEQLRIYNSYVDKTDQTSDNAEQIELQAIQTDKQLHMDMGVKPSGPLPPGAYARNTVIGYKIIKSSPDEVSAWVLARVTQKNSETAKEQSSYTRTLAGVVWSDGDWKLSGAATKRAMQETANKSEPKMVAPGDAAFNSAGWTAIRQAS
ncbi:hypothetical protein ACWCP6_28550 [Streptomyces sp. NPDC002004]